MRLRRTPHLTLLLALSLCTACSNETGTAMGPGDLPPSMMDPDGGIPSDVDAGGMGELPPDVPPSRPIETLEDQLRELGIDVDGERAAGRRIDPDTVAGDDWAPLGQRVRLAPRELFLVGAEDGVWRDSDPSTPDVHGPRSIVVEIWDESVGAVAPSNAFVRYEDGSRTPAMSPRPDNSGVRPGSQAGRGAAAADFDGDGRDEAVLVRSRSLPSGGYALEAIFVEGEGGDYRWELPVHPAGNSPVRDLAVAAGEMNGDGNADLLVVYLKDRYLGLMPFPGQGNGHLDQRIGAGTNVIDLPETTGTRSIEIAQGNLDFDPALETVLLLRTWDATLSGGEPSGSVQYFIYDDWSADPFRTALLAQGNLQLPAHGASSLVSPVTANVAISDFDGDGLDEIALAGLTRVSMECDDNHYGVILLDDLAHERAELAQITWGTPTYACSAGGEGSSELTLEVMTHGIAWDADHEKELLVNDHIVQFDGRSLSVGSSPSFMPTRSERPFSHRSHAIAVGDVTHDGLEEILVYSAYDGTLRAMGHQRRSDGEIEPFFSLLVQYDGGEQSPILIAFDNDDDGQVLEYVPGSHRVELSEPLIHAVLAAPPCSTALGQDLSECTTTYGNASSTGVETTETTTGSVSATVGVKVGADLGPFSFEASYQATMEAWTSATTGSGYELTYSVDYTTMGRDAVVFTSVPFDVYEYQIVRSSDPSEVGQTLAFLFPRRPVTRPVSISYFNARVRPGGLRIDENVISHISGDPTTYKTRDDIYALESAVRGRDPHEPFAFLRNGPRDVGASATSVGVGIEISETRFVEEGFGVSRTHSVEVTGGVVVAGVSVGSEESNTIQTSMSESTSFYGSVPGISDEHYGYAFGMFTYMAYARGAEGEGQTFHVIDYWVE